MPPFEDHLIVLAIAFILLALLAIIAWLLIDRHRRRSAERQTYRRLLDIVDLNRVAAAGALSACMAHELNDRLAVIMGGAEATELLLAAESPDLDQVKEIIAEIRQANQHAADVIQRSYNSLRQQGNIELQEFDLNGMIADTLQILAVEAQKRGVTLSANRSRRRLPVLANELRVQQVILNLAMNAMDAMARSARRTRKLTFETSTRAPSLVQVSVADSGTGIPGEKLGRVFDMFYTTKPQGAGLGLPIARTIIESYGGKIWAENQNDGGAVFRFILPLAEPA